MLIYENTRSDSLSIEQISSDTVVIAIGRNTISLIAVLGNVCGRSIACHTSDTLWHVVLTNLGPAFLHSSWLARPGVYFRLVSPE